AAGAGRGPDGGRRPAPGGGPPGKRPRPGAARQTGGRGPGEAAGEGQGAAAVRRQRNGPRPPRERRSRGGRGWPGGARRAQAQVTTGWSSVVSTSLRVISSRITGCQVS